jgi:hypothetical protein
MVNPIQKRHKMILKRRSIKKYFLLIFFIGSLMSYSQVVYEDINNKGIYEFLDELANLKVIELNSVIKPYSRQYIAYQLKGVLDRLNELENMDKSDSLSKLDHRILKLNKRQRRELAFYWQDYQIDVRCAKSDGGYAMGEGKSEMEDKMKRGKGNSGTQISDPESDCPIQYDHKLNFLFKKKPEFAVPLNPLAFQYKDQLFALSVRPVGGIFYLVNENGSMYQRYWGASAFMYIGKNFGGYASLRDNYATELLVQPEYFSLATGGVYKLNEGGRKGGDWSEMRGGITASWKWGSIGLYKDFITWGNNYHGANIISDHAPSFPFVQLHIKPVKWFEFRYIHAWLASKVMDSTRSYWVDQTYRIVYHNKYLAANMVTVTPWKRLNISFGNSIVYSGDINPAFLIPFMFFKSVDHSSYFNNNAGSNAQMFFDISSRQIRHLHLYVTLFIDELKMSRILKDDQHNFTSWKLGFQLSDLPVRNLSFTGEYTMTQPGTYQHYISTTTYTSNHYNMGNYLRDNSQEIYGAIDWRPLRGLLVHVSYLLAEHGDDVVYGDVSGSDIVKLPFMENKTWQNNQFELMARYQLSSGIYIWMQYLNTNRKGDLKFSPEIMHGKTNTFLAGLNIGF